MGGMRVAPIPVLPSQPPCTDIACPPPLPKLSPTPCLVPLSPKKGNLSPSTPQEDTLTLGLPPPPLSRDI